MNFNLKEAIQLVFGKIESWLEIVVSMLPNLVVATLVLIAFYFIAKIVRGLFSKTIIRFVGSTALSSLFTTIVHFAIVAMGLVIALNILQLKQTVTSLLAGAGIIGLALGFAFQDIAANFMSGILMAIRKPIMVGDIVETNGYMGTVEKINLRVTVVKTFQGLHVIIPNKEVFQSPLTNYTKTNERRIDLECGVSYEDDLHKVKKIAEETIMSLSFLLEGKEVNLYFTSFGDSSINFKLMFWITYPDQPGFMKARSEAIMSLKQAFDENGITIPYPIRTLDFGANDGIKFSEVKSLEK